MNIDVRLYERVMGEALKINWIEYAQCLQEYVRRSEAIAKEPGGGMVSLLGGEKADEKDSYKPSGKFTGGVDP